MRNQILFLSTLLFVFLASCQKQKTETVIPQAEPAKTFKSGVEDPCYEESFVMYGGQTIEVGTLTVSNDEDEIFVTYDLSGTDWHLDETHVFVGNVDDMPLNRPGNPKIGNFPYSESHNGEQVYTYTFLREDFDDCFAVAAHAVVEQYDANGNNIGEETAWADGGTEFPGKRWGWYLERFCVEDCVPDVVCNEAYGYFADISECFTDYGFNEIGWTNGPVELAENNPNGQFCIDGQLISCPQSCEPEVDNIVGEMKIRYNTNDDVLRIQFFPDPDITITEAYAYVGEEPFPLNGDNEYTIDVNYFNRQNPNVTYNMPNGWSYKFRNIVGIDVNVIGYVRYVRN